MSRPSLLGFVRWMVVWWPHIALGLGVGTAIPYALDTQPPRKEISGTVRYPEGRHAYRPGEKFDAFWQLTYVRDCQLRANRWMTSEADKNLVGWLPAEEIRLRNVAPPVLPVRTGFPAAGFVIPSVPPGRYYYRVRGFFACNWLQELVPRLQIVVDFPALAFEVEAPPAPAATPPPTKQQP